MENGLFEAGDTVKRKDSHRNSWWEMHHDPKNLVWIVDADEDPSDEHGDQTITIMQPLPDGNVHHKTGKNYRQVCVYSESMELVD